mmetsp:Transcript_79942/g.222733  ORF Transcript_79942/g.222733 Transcript_79942/m.222733 type:complete len:502 (-) Transcript_79942:30-1535(-)
MSHIRSVDGENGLTVEHEERGAPIPNGDLRAKLAEVESMLQSESLRCASLEAELSKTTSEGFYENEVNCQKVLAEAQSQRFERTLKGLQEQVKAAKGAQEIAVAESHRQVLTCEGLQAEFEDLTARHAAESASTQLYERRCEQLEESLRSAEEQAAKATQHDLGRKADALSSGDVRFEQVDAGDTSQDFARENQELRQRIEDADAKVAYEEARTSYLVQCLAKQKDARTPDPRYEVAAHESQALAHRNQELRRLLEEADANHACAKTGALRYEHAAQENLLKYEEIRADHAAATAVNKRCAERCQQLENLLIAAEDRASEVNLRAEEEAAAAEKNATLRAELDQLERQVSRLPVRTAELSTSLTPHNERRVTSNHTTPMHIRDATSPGEHHLAPFCPSSSRRLMHRSEGFQMASSASQAVSPRATTAQTLARSLTMQVPTHRTRHSSSLSMLQVSRSPRASNVVPLSPTQSFSGTVTQPATQLAGWPAVVVTSARSTGRGV